jgi:hypothetical protein
MKCKQKGCDECRHAIQTAPISDRAKASLIEMLRAKGCFIAFNFKPTFSERISGKSLAQIEKERKEALRAEWERREKEGRKAW